MNLRQFIILALIGAVLGLIASSVEKWWIQDQPPGSYARLQLLPEFSLTSMDGSIWHSGQRGQKILVLNYWATWCPPCRKEMPLFSQLQAEFANQDVQFIGIAIDDREAVQEFIDSHAVDFTILLGDMQAIALSERMGNRFSALPFTVIVDKGGKIVSSLAGSISERQLRPLLAELVQ